jgi:HlyD family secretion protein/epimerase transport system membrane fusion protein
MLSKISVLTASPLIAKRRRTDPSEVWVRAEPRAKLEIHPTRRYGVYLGVPHGPKARLILLYLQGEALKRGWRVVELGRSMRQWLLAMGSSAVPPDDGQALWGSLRRPMLIGVAIIAVFVGGFGVWGTLAPLAGGAVAPGVISPDGNRKAIQHLEGGIIEKILVQDGDVVAPGDQLIVLQETEARATFEMLRNQQRTLQATLARLTAEQLLHDAVTFPAVLEETRGEPEVADILANQERLFATQQVAHETQKKILRQRIEQLGEQIRGLEAQLASAERQAAIVEEELSGKKILLEKGLLPKPAFLALQRQQVTIAGNRGEYRAEIARAEQQIGETELQLLAVDAERAGQVAQELDKVRAALAQVEERLFASRDILARAVITAPVSGTVVNLAFRTRGGVVRPSELIMEIVPLEDDLLIDARVAPTDIDVVHPGLSAQVHLSAYSARIMPRIDGTVRSVSADRLIDKQTGQPYYLARVELDREALTGLGQEIELVPGMPAEVLIVTGERTMLEYLFEPFSAVLWRAFA